MLVFGNEIYKVKIGHSKFYAPQIWRSSIHYFLSYNHFISYSDLWDAWYIISISLVNGPIMINLEVESWWYFFWNILQPRMFHYIIDFYSISWLTPQNLINQTKQDQLLSVVFKYLGCLYSLLTHCIHQKQCQFCFHIPVSSGSDFARR